MIYSTLVFMHWFAALILFVEVVNKMYECKAMNIKMTWLERFAAIVRGGAYCLLGLASCGVLIAPVLRGIDTFGGHWVNPLPSVSECMAYIAFAAIVLRRWMVTLVFEVRASRKDAALKQKPPAMAPAEARDNNFVSHHGVKP